MSGTAARPADNQPYLFISYASADRTRVLPLVDGLNGRDRAQIRRGASQS